MVQKYLFGKHKIQSTSDLIFDWILCSCVLLLTIGLLFIFIKTFSLSLILESTAEEYKWVVHGFINILGYSTVLIPGYLIYRHLKKTNYLDKTGMLLVTFSWMSQSMRAVLSLLSFIESAGWGSASQHF